MLYLVVIKPSRISNARCLHDNSAYDTDLTLANHFVSFAMVGLLTPNGLLAYLLIKSNIQ